MKPDDLLTDLNEEQKAAVTHGDGPLLIVAGAGTGKTTVITRRIAWFILSQKCTADEILALTFTEKAATEMEERVDRLLPYGYVNLWISTFHAFCERILKSHALEIGLPNDFTLLDTTAAWMLVRRNIDRFDLDYYRPLGNPTKFIHALLRHFSRAKDEEVGPSEYLFYAEKLQLDQDSAGGGKGIDDEARRISEIAHAYHTYQQILLEHNALDFGDLITYSLKLFRERPTLLEKYRRQFKYFLVDEFQDTNWAQYELIKLLAHPQNNITVVGDDDQAVYKFRGASLANILEFKKDYPQSREVVLIQNYRSGQTILDTAYAFIQLNNPNRLEYTLLEAGITLSKKLQSQREYPGEVTHIHCATLREEVSTIIQKIISLREQDPELQWGDCAILVRSNDSADPFIERLTALDIPHFFLNLKGLYNKSIIIDLLAYMRLLDNYHESPSLFRVLQLSFFGLAPHTLIEITHTAARKALSLWQVVHIIETIPDIPAPEQEKVRIIVALIEKHTSFAKTHRLAEILLCVIQEVGFLAHIKAGETRVQRESVSHLNQLYRKARDIQTHDPGARLKDFCVLLALEQEAGDEGRLAPDVELGPDTVKIMTIHASKGLEFEYVFVANMVDRRFPTVEREDALELPDALVKEHIPRGDIHLEEERRLFYVALTRAKQGVFLTSAQDYGGSRKKKLSRFLTELELADTQKEIGSQSETIECPSPPSNSGTAQPGPFVLPVAFSFTQLAAFQKCPLQYKYAFLLKIPTFGKAQVSFGKTMHATLQIFFQRMLERAAQTQQDLFSAPKMGYTSPQIELLPLSELLAIYDQQWVDDWYPSQGVKQEYVARGRTMLRGLHEQFQKTPPRPKFIEHDFTLKIEGTALKGRIDRIDTQGIGAIEILDYKTGTSKTEKSLAADDKAQLIIYQIAAEEVLHERVEKLTYVYLDDGTTVSFLASEKEKVELKAKISETATRIRASDFSPTPGFHCKFCDFKDICEYKKI